MTDLKSFGSGRVVDEPLRVGKAEDVAWDETADVVVVGLGGAGASAALQAHESGADVLVLERFEGGGSTAYSGGVYYAGGTKFQRDAGVEDSADNLFNYLSQEIVDCVSPQTLRRFCDESEANINWLVNHGLQFEGSLYSLKATYPPEDKYLYYAGNEKVPAFAAKAKPAARGHRTKGKGWTGYKFYEGLRNAIARTNIRVAEHSRVTRLVVEDGGRVVGCEVLRLKGPAEREAHQALYKKVIPTKIFNQKNAEKAIGEAFSLEERDGKRVLVRAKGGVILATGGFTYNLPMLTQYHPFLGKNFTALMRLGSAGCSGAGIQLGASAGGLLAKMDHKFVGRTVSPPAAQAKGIIVNERGERFAGEDLYTSLLGEKMLQQKDGKAWLILDEELYKTSFKQSLPGNGGTFMNFGLPALLNYFFGGTKKAATPTELAKLCGFPPGVLEKTIADTNAAAEGKIPDPVGKYKDYFHVFGKGPYRAVNFSVANPFSFVIVFTLGGLKVDETRGLVLSEKTGEPIEGLYAAGRAAMGLPSDGYISGLSLADCVFSGRRAGRDAAIKRQEPAQAFTPQVVRS